MRCRWCLFALPLLLVAGGCAHHSLAAYEKSMVYRPSSAEVGNWSPPPELGFEEVNFVSRDGTRLHGWFLDHPQRRAVVLFTHGNGGNVAMWGHSLKYLCDRHQVAGLVFDYRGYGKSEGQPDERGIYEDAEAAQQWLAQRTGIAPESVVLMGQSLGGGVAVDLASRTGARGLVLMSTFTSAPDVAKHHLPWLPARLLMTQRYNSLEKIKSYHGPLLVCHGDADRVIPYEEGKRLFEASPSTDKKFITNPGGDHNDPPSEEYRFELDAFFYRLPPEKPYEPSVPPAQPGATGQSP